MSYTNNNNLTQKRMDEHTMPLPTRCQKIIYYCNFGTDAVSFGLFEFKRINIR